VPSFNAFDIATFAGYQFRQGGAIREGHPCLPDYEALERLNERHPGSLWMRMHPRPCMPNPFRLWSESDWDLQVIGEPMNDPR
jgi:hypothetical protein